jgi:arylsulfatase A-like enzyme
MYATYDPEEPWTSDYVQWLADERFDGAVEAVIERANADEETFRVGAFRQFLLGSNWRSEEEHSNTWVADESVEFLETHREEPFFLFSSFFGPHQPMAAPGQWADYYDPADVELPETFETSLADKPLARKRVENGSVVGRLGEQSWPAERYREILAAYYGQISMIDHCVGRILDSLEREGIAEETVVLFTADHGDHAGQFGWFFKGSLYERSARVPLIVRDPDGASGARVSGPVSNLGIYPTILKRAGVEPPAACSVRSLQPLVEDPNRDWEHLAYAEQHDERLIATPDGKVLTGDDAHGAPASELYLGSGPDETSNEWENPDYRDTQSALRKRLATCRGRAAAGDMLV